MYIAQVTLPTRSGDEMEEGTWLCPAYGISDAETIHGVRISLSLEIFSFLYVISHNVVPKHKSVVSTNAQRNGYPFWIYFQCNTSP